MHETPQVDPNEGNIVIEGLENFSFTDTPQEEIQLRVHFNKFIEQMQINELNLQKKQKQQEKEKMGGAGSLHQQHQDSANFYQTTKDQEFDGKYSVIADSMNITQSIAYENFN